MAGGEGRRHSGGSEDEDGVKRQSSSVHFRFEAGGRRSWPRTRKGAVNQIGTAAWNSLSRMPGSWSGIANPTGYEVGRNYPCLEHRSSPETGNRILTSMPSYEASGLPPDSGRKRCHQGRCVETSEG